MNAEIEETNDKSNIQDYPLFNGKLELIFKMMNVLISLSLSECQFSDENTKNDLLKKYDDLFKKINKEMLLSTKSSFQKDLFNTILADMKLFNTKLVQIVFSVLQTFKKFMTREINIDVFLEELIISLKSAVTQIKENNGKNRTFNLINEFYQYLKKFSEKINNLKQVVSKKNFEEGEIKLKEKEDIYKELTFKIETLKKQLEEKGKDLENTYLKSMQLSLDKSSLKENNEILTKKLGDSKITIKEKKKDDQEYRNKIDKMENILSSLEQKYTFLEKSNSKNAAEIEKLKNTISAEIQNLKNIEYEQEMEIQNLKTTQYEHAMEIQNLKATNSEFAKEIQNLKTTQSEFTKEIQNLKTTQSEFAKEIQNLKATDSEYATEIQNLKATKSEYAEEIQNLKEKNSIYATEIQNLKKISSKNSLKIQKLENDNFQMKNENKFLEWRIGKLEKEIVHLFRLNDEIRQNIKKEFAQIKNEQIKNLRICKNNFKELKNMFKI